MAEVTAWWLPTVETAEAVAMIIAVVTVFWAGLLLMVLFVVIRVLRG